MARRMNIKFMRCTLCTLNKFNAKSQISYTFLYHGSGSKLCFIDYEKAIEVSLSVVRQLIELIFTDEVINEELILKLYSNEKE